MEHGLRGLGIITRAGSRSDPLRAQVDFLEDRLGRFAEAVGGCQKPGEIPHEPLLEEIDPVRGEAGHPVGRAQNRRLDHAHLLEDVAGEYGAGGLYLTRRCRQVQVLGSIRTLEFRLGQVAASTLAREPSERFKRFTYEDLLARDKVSLDIFWLRDDSLTDTDDLPPPAVLAAEIAEDLQAALEEIQTLADSLSTTPGTNDAESGD